MVQRTARSPKTGHRPLYQSGKSTVKTSQARTLSTRETVSHGGRVPEGTYRLHPWACKEYRRQDQQEGGDAGAEESNTRA